MTTPELIAAVARASGVPEERASEMIREVFGAVADVMLSGTSVTVDDFATFEHFTRRARRGRNPRTGERIIIPEKGAVRFKPAASLKRRAAREQ